MVISSIPVHASYKNSAGTKNASKQAGQPGGFADLLATRLGDSALPEAISGASNLVGQNPTYRLTTEQINNLKSRYDVENMTDDEYCDLMDELTALGVTAKGDGLISRSDTGLMVTLAPAVLGLFKSDGSAPSTSFPTFTSGNFIGWAKSQVAHYDAMAEWLKTSEDNLNSKQLSDKNIASIERFKEKSDRMIKILEQLK